MRVLDLTHTIAENMPVYPGTGTPKLLPANVVVPALSAMA